MLGGGTFVTQNKVLPGSYINFVSADNGVNVFGDRGTGAIGIGRDYFAEGLKVVTKEDFQKNALIIFGYDYSDTHLAWARDFFKNSQTLIVGSLNSNGATKANNAYCTAKCYGDRGNDLKTVIQTNVDNTDKFDVSTYIGTTIVDKQTVTKASELKDNDFVTFKTDASLVTTASTALTGGKNGTLTGDTVSKFLTALESYSFNAVTTCGNHDDLVVEWTKRMRDEVGKKFQCVVYNCDAPDYEGCVYILGGSKGNFGDTSPWICGALAGCEINKSLTNVKYTGEYLSQEDALGYVSEYSQAQLEDFVNNGVFAFHRVGDEVRVLADINSLTTYTDDKGSVFNDNQTIRVCDQVAMDIATIFNNYYLGKVPNDDIGRTTLWGEIVKHHNSLMSLRAIENFTSDDVTVEQGDNKKAVVVNDRITPVSAMSQLYMTVIVQ